MTGRSIALFIAAALAAIGGAYLVWIGIKEHKGPLVIALVVALGLYGVVATAQPSSEFGRVLAAYDGVFIIGSCCGASPSAEPRGSPRPVRFDSLQVETTAVASRPAQTQ